MPIQVYDTIEFIVVVVAATTILILALRMIKRLTDFIMALKEPGTYVTSQSPSFIQRLHSDFSSFGKSKEVDEIARNKHFDEVMAGEIATDKDIQEFGETDVIQ